jgi:hypothetical protein
VSLRLAAIGLCGLLVLGSFGAAQGAYYDDPKDVDVTGPYTQDATGMVFPDAVGAFKRTDVISYNSERTDESATYIQEKDGKESVAITIYVYPVPLDVGSALSQALPQADVAGALYMLTEQLFADEEQAIGQVHRGTQILDEGITSHDERGLSYPGTMASFRYSEDFFGDVEMVRSQLYLFSMVGGKWMVKYRVTYPETTDGAAQANLFMHALPWTIRGLNRTAP